jgi:N-acetylmuramic acid 6-phosphate etherase
MTSVRLSTLATERVGSQFTNLHQMSTEALVEAMNQNDHDVARSVGLEMKSIQEAIDRIVIGLTNGGRLIYFGAGTSGRLGVLDASECVPTFNTSPELVRGFIAGGDFALRYPVEGAEDLKEDAAAKISTLNLTVNDSVVGITASGRTPYVIGALEEAKRRDSFTVALSCNKNSEAGSVADIAIEIDCGPEFIAGSTRLKAGTATKMVLNMISTISMVKLGKVYRNLMIDLKVTNYKLQQRAISILIYLTGCSEEVANINLEAANKDVRVAFEMIKSKVGAIQAIELLKESENNLEILLDSPNPRLS